MSDALASTIVLALGALWAIALARPLNRLERAFMLGSYAAHGLAGLAQVLIARGVYGGGDNLFYMSQASLLGHAIEVDPERFGAMWLELLLQREVHDSLPILGEQSSTGSMIAVATLLAIPMRYSLYGASFGATVFAYTGKWALYRALRETFAERARPPLLIAVFAMPSVVFWSSGLQKEAFVTGGMGIAWLGIHRALRGHLGVGLVLALVGMAPIGLLKAYTLFALAIAAAVWIGLDRLRVRSGGRAVKIRPHYLILAAGIGVGAVVVLGQLFPRYSIDRLGEDIAMHQRVGAMMVAQMDSPGGGASGYALGMDEEEVRLSKQLALAPLATATALFRPFPFEANNALAFAASLEMLALTIILVRSLARAGPGRMLAALLAHPVLCACLSFAVLFGAGVGLATTNFGSLSRYRMPLIPLYATVVLLMNTLGRNANRAPLPLSRPVLRRRGAPVRPGPVARISR